MRKYHAPFWRATGEVTHLLTLIEAGAINILAKALRELSRGGRMSIIMVSQ